jgi:uncharacterized protein (TIGR02246 family)
MKGAFLIGFIISALLFFNSCDTPLNDYKPKSEDEKQISALLNTYLEARNSGDLVKLQSTFHDDGVYISGRGGQFTKTQIAETKPEFWVSDGEVQLLNPEIKVNGNEATVMATAKYGTAFKTAAIYTLVKENGHWLIMKRE